MHGGSLRLARNQQLRLATGTTNRLGGTLQWSPAKELHLRPGDTFTLLPGIGKSRVEGAFDQLILPDLPPGLRWNTEKLYSAGTITVTPMN